MEGWIKLHRGLLDWEWADKPEMVALFVHLLCMANTEDHEWHGTMVERGQIVTGRKELSKKTGISEQTIRTCINRLKSTNTITIKATNKYSIITICNFDKYQLADKADNQTANQQTNQQLTNNQPTTNQQLTTLKEYKNIRIIKKEINKEKKEGQIYVSKVLNGQEPETEYEKFTAWIQTECPNAAKVQRQMTEAEFIKLQTLYGNKMVEEAIMALDNWRDFPKKRTSLYRSTLDELKKIIERQGTTSKTAPRDDRGKIYEEF
ncbi:MAG: hypothetical protein MJZ26_08945 [Fibrobacter sp.]|nr:hypothetical protein [Fibrobacter sp.]